MSLNQAINLNSLLYRWLMFVAIMHVLGGIALAFDFPAALWQAYRQDLYGVFSLSRALPEDTDMLISMILRLFGPTVASWGLLMIYLLRRTFIQNDKTALFYLVTATVVWFLLDTSISLSFGVMSHLYINSVAFTAILLPLIIFKLKAK